MNAERAILRVSQLRNLCKELGEAGKKSREKHGVPLASSKERPKEVRKAPPKTP